MRVRVNMLDHDKDDTTGEAGSLDSGLSSRRTIKPYEKQPRFSEKLYENKDYDNDWDDGNVR